MLFSGSKPTKENFYHGILLGLLGFKAGWTVTSNREAGDGFSDIMIRIDGSELGIIIEVKYAEKQMEEVCRTALEQIDKMHYADDFRRDGFSVVLKYGIACNRKACKVLAKKEQLVN